MSLYIFIAHTGICLTTELKSFTSYVNIQFLRLYQSSFPKSGWRELFFADLVRQCRASSVMDLSKLLCRYSKPDPYDRSWEAGQASDFTGRGTLKYDYWFCAADPKFRMKSFSTTEEFSPLHPPRVSVHCSRKALFQTPTISDSHQTRYQMAIAFWHGIPCSKRDGLGQFKSARVHLNRLTEFEGSILKLGSFSGVPQ